MLLNKNGHQIETLQQFLNERPETPQDLDNRVVSLLSSKLKQVSDTDKYIKETFCLYMEIYMMTHFLPIYWPFSKVELRLFRYWVIEVAKT